MERKFDQASVVDASRLPAIMSVAEVAAVLKRTDETVCAFIRRGELVASGLGTDRRGHPCAPYAVFAEDLIAFLRGRRISPAQASQATAPDSSAEKEHAGRRRKSARRPPKLVTPRSSR